MHAFDYAAPETIAEAIELLASRNGNACILGGGTDLLAQLKEGKGRPALVVDIKHVPELMAMSCNRTDGLSLGASVSCHQMNTDAAVQEIFPALHDSSGLIGGTQIQGRASFGGNLCNSSPAADSIPNLIVHSAVCHIQGPDGVRTVKVEDFCTGPGRNVLEAGELLVRIHIPPPDTGFGASYLRFIPRNEMDIAVVGAGASVVLEGDTIQSGRVALGAVAPTPLFVEAAGEAMAGQTISDALIERVGAIARDAARPIADMRGTIEQRKHLSGVLTRRALTGAIARARGA